jgi:hypothetical protein
MIISRLPILLHSNQWFARGNDDGMLIAWYAASSLMEKSMQRHTIATLLASLSFIACTSAIAAPLVIDVTGIQSYDDLGNPGNTVLTFNVGANATITSFAYDVTLSTVVPSYLSEIGLQFSNSAGTGFDFAPGFGDDRAGTASYAASTDLGTNSFTVGADGLLRLEFFEFFDDFDGMVDGRWDIGTLTFGIQDAPQGVPEPATGLLMGAGLALMGYAAQRRRTPIKAA